MRPRADRAGLAITAILALAFLLRVLPAGYGLPERFYPDEYRYVAGAQRMLGGDLDPHYFQNPSLWTYLLSLEYGLLFLLDRLLGHSPGLLGFVFATDPSRFYLLARVTAALLGTATVWLVWRTGRRLFGPRAGLMAALVLAVALLAVRESHVAVNDTAAVFLLVLSLYFSADLALGGAARSAALAGLTAGLAIAAKYNAGIALVALTAGHLLSPARREWKRLGAAFALAGLGFLLGCPYAVLAPREFLSGFAEQAGFAGAGWRGQSDLPSWAQYGVVLAHGFGAIPLLLALGAAVDGLGRPSARPRTLLVLAVPLAYLAYMLQVRLFFARFALPLLPCLALLAGAAFARLSERLRERPGPGRVLAPLVLLLVVAQPFAWSLRHTMLLLREDTRQRLTRWAREALPEGAGIALEGFAPTLAAYGASVALPSDPWGEDYRDLERRLRELPRERGWRVHQLSADPGYRKKRMVDELRGLGVRYVLLSSFTFGREAGKPAPFYQELEERGRLFHRVSPLPGGDSPRFHLDNLNSPFHDLFALERAGPELLVYELP